MNARDIEKAYQWSQKEIKDYNIPITEQIRIVHTDGYEDSPDATVSLFYDRHSGKALCRVHWETGHIRYDEVVNYNELRFTAPEFVKHLMQTGIKLSRLYTAFGL